MLKYLFVYGGVISGVGKGVTTSSIAKIIKEYGYKVNVAKIDPYINCDAGTLRPTEHGEVWVTDDGGEIDQDLGNYERFLEQNLSKKNSITTGQIYKSLIEKERRGDFLGETVQFIPHVPREIISRLQEIGEGNDVLLVEIGGTVGDYENVPFLFAAKKLENELGKENVCHILVTYMPIPSHINEMKTKPTQLAIKLLKEEGIQPDFILCRGKEELDEPRKRKIEEYSNIPANRIISMPDVSGEGKPNTIYIIPLNLEQEKFGEKILGRLNLEIKKAPDWRLWKERIDSILRPEKEVDIAIVGKYLETGNYQLTDSYLSIDQALKHAGAKNKTKINIHWISSKSLEEGSIDLSKYKGILIPGGFGSSGVEGKIKAIQYAREKNVPFLGICYGLQLAVVEFARNVCGLDANTTEVNPNVLHKVIDILPEQKAITEKGATMRLGSYPAILKETSKVAKIYGKTEITERHRHRYEVNPDYHKLLEEKGLVLSGKSPDERLVEFIELPNNKFFVATQAHPEFKSSLINPAPLFDGFVKSCLD